MYLSQLMLNPHSRQVQNELANCYELHRTVLSAFRGETFQQERVLFRVEMRNEIGGGMVRMLVQSRCQPDWTVLEKDRRQPYLVKNGGPNPQVKEFAPVLRPGMLLQFRLLANPTARKKSAETSRSERIGLYCEAEQINWLARKAANHGFTIENVGVTPQGKVRGWAYMNGRRNDLILLAVQFDGVLRVTNADALLTALENGIGSAKGFGFGLLSLARVRE